MLYILIILTRLLNVVDCVPDYLIDDEVTIIECYAFVLCDTILKTFSFGPNPELQELGDFAFAYCKNLIEINLSKCNKLTSIGEKAFLECSNVQTLSLPANLQNIGKYAFLNCLSIISIDLSNLVNLSIINEHAFGGCEKSINLKIPNSLKSIEQGVFYYNSNLYQVYLPSSVTYIHDDAFHSCYNLTVFRFDENSKLQYIGYNAFSETKINNITIPRSVSNITRIGLENWNIDSNNENFYEEDGFIYSRNKDVIFIYSGTSEDIVIADTVKIIQDFCFYNDSRIKNVHFPENMERIGKYAFSDCSQLVSINIKFIKTIDSNAFNNCDNLNNFKIESVDILQDSVFQDCYNLMNIELNHCKIISSRCFYNCGISNITIPSSVTHIYDEVFKYCDNLETVNFEDESRIQYIGPFAFQGTKINYLHLPKSLMNFTKLNIDHWSIHPESQYFYEMNDMIYSINTEIAFVYRGSSDVIEPDERVKVIQDYCFYECQSITNFIFRGNLDRIGNLAFSNCRNLKSISIKSVNTLGYHSMYNCDNLVTLDIKIKRFSQIYPFTYYPELAEITDFKYGDFIATKDTLICNSYGISFTYFHATKSQFTHIDIDCDVISQESFKNSENLETIVMKKVIRIDDEAFIGCTKLKYIYVSDKLIYFKNNDYSYEKIFVLNNKSSVVEMLVENGFDREKIFSWELPLFSNGINIYIVNRLGINYINAIIHSSSALFFLTPISSFYS